MILTKKNKKNKINLFIKTLLILFIINFNIIYFLENYYLTPEKLDENILKKKDINKVYIFNKKITKIQNYNKIIILNFNQTNIQGVIFKKNFNEKELKKIKKNKNYTFVGKLNLYKNKLNIIILEIKPQV